MSRRRNESPNRICCWRATDILKTLTGRTNCFATFWVLSAWEVVDCGFGLNFFLSWRNPRPMCAVNLSRNRKELPHEYEDEVCAGRRGNGYYLAQRRRVVFRRDLQDFSMENRRYRSMGAGVRPQLFSCISCPTCLKNNPVNPVNPVQNLKDRVCNISGNIRRQRDSTIL